MNDTFHSDYYIAVKCILCFDWSTLLFHYIFVHFNSLCWQPNDAMYAVESHPIQFTFCCCRVSQWWSQEKHLSRVVATVHTSTHKLEECSLLEYILQSQIIGCESLSQSIKINSAVWHKWGTARSSL